MTRRFFCFAFLFFFSSGCMTLFGWDIHAPGILSANFHTQTTSVSERVALFLPDHFVNYVSTDRGTALSDPQVYHIGEAASPMMIEAFQASFDEFILMEMEPTPALMHEYQIPYLVVVDAKHFTNEKNLKGQRLALRTQAWIFDPNLELLARIEADGSSDAKRVFAKEGGPEVNLNAAIENNIIALTQFLQDVIGNRL